MAPNPTTEGPVKSLRQAAPGGDVIAVVFGLIALFVVVSVVRNRPDNLVALVIAGVFILAFAIPAYVLWTSARDTGIFVTADRVEYKVMAQTRQSWSLSEVKSVEPLSGGLKLMGQDGHLLREVKFRWWTTEQVARFANGAGLAPGPVLPLSAQMNPGEAGQA
jgi:hypothetical protein